MEAKELIDYATSEAINKFAFAIYPIYAFVEENDPTLIGTCYAIEYKNRKFLVTAAHVIDNHKYATLALSASAGEPIVIQGEFHIVDLNGKIREDDPWDFAWHELTVGEAKNISCIPENDIETHGIPGVGVGLYVAIGFPVSKNKKIKPEDRRNRRLSPNRASYMNVQVDATEYFEERGMSAVTHIAIKRENRSVNSGGDEGNTIGHKGLSGGPLIDTGMRLPAGTTFSQKVSGIVLEGSEKNKILVALRLSVVLRHIEKIINISA
ncbi:hypothetical protein [Burkholderia gladioli]|uniref:hypothetical protein n=1 Tax=Burkholderia gladioli TaxID=28095 RepID=UPI00163F4CA9|nr:hypothetical protein [Burkholderia gladioli]